MTDQAFQEIIQWLNSYWVQIVSGMAIGFLLALTWHAKKGGFVIAITITAVLVFGCFAEFISHHLGGPDYWEKKFIPSWPKFLPVPNTSAWWALILGVVIMFGVIGLWSLNWIGQVAVTLAAIFVAIFIVLPPGSSWRGAIIADWKVIAVVIALLALGAAIHPQGRLGRVVGIVAGVTAIVIFFTNIGWSLIGVPVEKTIAWVDKVTACDAECKAERAAREARRLAEREDEKKRKETAKVRHVAAKPQEVIDTTCGEGFIARMTVGRQEERIPHGDCVIHLEVAPLPDNPAPCVWLRESRDARPVRYCRGSQVVFTSSKEALVASATGFQGTPVKITVCWVFYPKGRRPHGIEQRVYRGCEHVDNF